jgi:hypothetical protein
VAVALGDLAPVTWGRTGDVVFEGCQVPATAVVRPISRPRRPGQVTGGFGTSQTLYASGCAGFRPQGSFAAISGRISQDMVAKLASGKALDHEQILRILRAGNAPMSLASSNHSQTTIQIRKPRAEVLIPSPRRKASIGQVLICHWHI